MALTDELKKFLTINTHYGLYQYTQLPFGVASALAIFQKAMDDFLQGLPNDICYLNNILVTGASNQENLKNLRQVYAEPSVPCAPAKSVTMERSTLSVD